MNYKLIARDPTEDMIEAVFQRNSATLKGDLLAAWYAAPHIKTEAEKRAREWIDNNGVLCPMACEIIQSLLDERNGK